MHLFKNVIINDSTHQTKQKKKKTLFPLQVFVPAVTSQQDPPRNSGKCFFSIITLDSIPYASHLTGSLMSPV